MSAYWPWWAGAVALATVTIGYTVLSDRSLGISSAWERVLHWREEREIERLDARLGDDDALEAALAAATRREFGALAVASPATDAAPDPGPAARPPAPPRPAPLVTQAALLVSVFVGGLVAALTSGRFEVRADMGEAFGRIVTDNPVTMVVVLFTGGVLVGFGTRLAGGCSSGHGLSGCGRLRPVSILATAVFFGTAVVVSLLLGGMS
ncbi:YeeE/YedE family protein [Pseudonocardia hydrocarbonoxydans]|uniref:Uncharacterized protein n=1 Tax=Pseudonocardia hydrocarbonoxydans TaxID=76726 RepID=A0A4Y3WR20_9PSEU|nr:YeeE/YedE thiosulfate transporter family protein [Pseudonocardia hydrocarbonoxydans]GEC21337.1 hypothetical protein PHY01_36200 [Pseudonocardia hydrocarbonoxydans]